MGFENDRTVDALPGLVWIAYPDGRMEFVNQLWRDYTGYSVGEASGEGWQVAIHPEDRPKLLQFWLNIVACGKPGEASARMRRFDGEYRWFLFRVSPVTAASGEIVKWCGINTDIEASKRASAALSVREQRFQSIVDGLPAVVLLTNRNGDLTQANRHAREYTGASVKEMSEWATNDLIHHDDRPGCIAKFLESIATERPFESEARYRRRDGVYRWFLVRGYPLRDDEGQIVLWYFLLVDIEDRKRAETLLAGEKRLLEMVVLGLPLPVVLQAVCQLVEEIDGKCYSSILLTDPDGKTFLRGGVSNLASGYIDTMSGVPGASNSGPCRMSVSLKSQVIVEDVSSDPRWTGIWRDVTLAYGLRSFWSTPILSRAHEPLGAFSIYRKEPGDPTPFNRDLIGQLTHVASIAIERARGDEALKRSEASFRAIVETTPESVKVIARDGTLLQANSASASVFGVQSAGALVGKCFYDFVIPEHRQRYVEFHQDVCEGKKGFLEFDVVTMQGELRHMETHGAPMQGGDGAMTQLGVTRDITARREAEENLRRSAALMAKAQQISSSGSFSWRPISGSISWSEQVYRIHEISPAAPITLEHIRTLLHPDDVHLIDDMIARAQLGLDVECDYRLRMPNGSIKYVYMQANPTHDLLDQIEYIGAVQDVTDRRQSEEALGMLHAELAHVTRVNSLGALTASIAHEINQPLAGIMTNASTCLHMLGAEPPNVEGALETVRRTLRDGQRASDVMTRLRALFSKKVVVTDSVDLNEAINEVIELLRSEMRRKQIGLRLERSETLPPVTGDRVQLQQVMLNLLLNAIEAMQGVEDHPRSLLIKTERDGANHIRLTVIDTGVGFEPQHAGKLFEAFYTTKREGMGIGLSVSRSIIESHGGRLWAASNKGPGATFSFSIPCGADNCVPTANRPGALERSAGPGRGPGSQ